MVANGCSPTEVRSELRRVLGSAHFNTSERNRRFLEYVVEETLAGRDGRIKAYTVGTDVFNRPPKFDPQGDPVVRMEACRLRRALEHFYLVEGKNGPVEIVIPKGGYVPEFRPANIDDSSVGNRDLTIRVGPFEPMGDHAVLATLTRGLSRQIMLELVQTPGLVVFAGGPEFRRLNQPTRQAKLDFILTGSVGVYGEVLSATALLVDGRLSQVLRGENFVRQMRTSPTPTWSDMANARDDVANCIVGMFRQFAGASVKRPRVPEAKHPHWGDVRSVPPGHVPL